LLAALDHPVAALADVVDADGLPAVAIVGEAADRDSAVAVILATMPDVVLLDVHLPGGGGHTVITELVNSQLAARFLALSVSDAADDVIAVVRAGARGYVTKTITVDELVDAIQRVHAGDAVFSPRLAEPWSTRSLATPPPRPMPSWISSPSASKKSSLQPPPTHRLGQRTAHRLVDAVQLNR